MGDDSMTDMKASDRRWGLASPVVVVACTCGDAKANTEATGECNVDLECPTHGTESEWYKTAREVAKSNGHSVGFVHAGPDECERCRNELSVGKSE
jgi:hypothetical protein